MKKNMTYLVGPAIRSLRMSRQMSQQELAELSDLDMSFISNLERNTQLPGFDTIYALAEAFGLKGSGLLKFIEDFNNKHN